MLSESDEKFNYDNNSFFPREWLSAPLSAWEHVDGVKLKFKQLHNPFNTSTSIKLTITTQAVN